MSRVRAPSQLPELVKTAFANARRDGELHYFPTQVTIVTVNSIPFQLRFSPSLANKPKGPARDPSKPQKVFDPFDNPPPPLRITDLGPSHILVLNKFAVVPEHFIVATREWKSQTHVLEAPDLEATRACIAAYRDAPGHGLFAFFNSGDHSGASQPHRHIQLLPVSRMRDGLDEESSWDVLVDRVATQPAPFATFTEPIGPDTSPEELHAAYLRLYTQACRAVAKHNGRMDADGDVPAEGEAQISYNMAMTETTLAVMPRLTEGSTISSQDGNPVGNLSLNGTVLAGTALVKSELEWETLKNNLNEFEAVLGKIGIPSGEVDDKL